MYRSSSRRVVAAGAVVRAAGAVVRAVAVRAAAAPGAVAVPAAAPAGVAVRVPAVRVPAVQGPAVVVAPVEVPEERVRVVRRVRVVAQAARPVESGVRRPEPTAEEVVPRTSPSRLPP